jgi:hypothetical protein
VKGSYFNAWLDGTFYGQSFSDVGTASATVAHIVEGIDHADWMGPPAFSVQLDDWAFFDDPDGGT